MQKKWTLPRAQKIFNQAFNDLMYQAQVVHRQNFSPNEIQISTLISVKTGGCPENCSYCPQSAHYDTGVQKETLLPLEVVVEAAQRAKEAGATRFCMGAAWRSPRDSDLEKICLMIKAVRKLGLETCVTLGMLKEQQAERLKQAGLDYYNHNIDSSEEFYDKIITTRSFSDRIDTLHKVRDAGIKICCGGILGMGENNIDRLNMLITLANLDEPPESLPINKLIRIPGTPLEEGEDVDVFDFVKIIATARILMPKTYIRLSAGREQLSQESQSLCFLAGANSIFYGEKLLTSEHILPEEDFALFQKLGLNAETNIANDKIEEKTIHCQIPLEMPIG